MTRRFSLTLVAATSVLPLGIARAQTVSANVHPTPPPRVVAVQRTTPVNIDGKLDEAAWSTAQPATEFRQSQPDEGRAGTQRTEVRFLYDEDAVYVGARMFDSLGARGVRTRLLRRDALEERDSDILQVIFDSYHDHSTRAFFWVNPSGSKRDGTGDPTWDPVWETAANIDSLGWTAELRIPFNQLNFTREEAQTWGLQIVRFTHRLNERTHWAWWANNEVGGPQRYGHLEGMRIENRPRGLEVLPYVVTQGKYIKPADLSNPLTHTTEYQYRVGGDVKYRLTSNLTLNATFNPDFGQVEVDPAVVNLSAFETFFQERRPFFIEGAGAFSFGSFSCFFCNNVSNLGMLHTRRIGRQPQLFPSGTYVDVPENTTILGAAKVTGRTAGGYSVGILDAFTRREKADVVLLDATTGARSDFTREAEPATNYFVGRVRKEIRGGATSFGAIVTSVDRFTDDSLAEARLPKAARGVGVDWFHSWKNRAYSFFGQFAVSDVRGSTLAIDRLQRSSARFFQRPDREAGDNGLFSDAYDPSARRLSGYGGYARVAKDGGEWLWETALNVRSPGFEVNDIAFLTSADLVYMYANLARSVQRPGRIYRNYFAVAGAQQQFNYDGLLTDREFNMGIFGQLRNFWQLNMFAIRFNPSFDDRRLRGGPSVVQAGYWYKQFFLGTDQRRRISFSTNPNHISGDPGTRSWRVNLDVRYTPTARVLLTAGPSYSDNEGYAQFVTSGADSTNQAFFGRRYIFALIHQKSLSMNTRVNVVFTPTLTFEAFAQPLISSGDYVQFREYVAPRQAAYRDFTSDQVTSTVVNGRRRYTIDADGAGPAQAISFTDPDFNFRSLRGNAVLRWEYRPGSTLFVVWQQNRAGQAAVGDFDFSRDRRALFGLHPDNIFLVKASYWFAW